MTDFVAYYRVSTDRQGRSGLGLEAQREAVQRFVAGRGGMVAEEFTEVESGRRNDRPQLAAALQACRRRRAVLVIAKLDRLARNVAFIAALMESGVEFTAADMPDANRLTIHILAAVAEHEREMISQRTRAALQAAKARGARLGSPTLHLVRDRGLAAAREAKARFRELARPLALEMRGDGRTLREIAAELNRRGVPTAHGRAWHASSVQNVLREAGGSV